MNNNNYILALKCYIFMSLNIISDKELLHIGVLTIAESKNDFGNYQCF